MMLQYVLDRVSMQLFFKMIFVSHANLVGLIVLCELCKSANKSTELLRLQIVECLRKLFV